MTHDTPDPRPRRHHRTGRHPRGGLHAYRPRETHERPGHRRPADWLVLAYLAGDNDLEGALLRDLREMERIGSRPGRVEILAQLDRAPGHDASSGDWTTARRYHVLRAPHAPRPTTAHTRPLASRLLADLGETNTGDPRVLEAFVAAGARHASARAAALFLLNHGSGVELPPELLASRHAPSARHASSPDPTRPLPRALRRTLFHPTRARLGALASPHRGIAYDDGSADCLDLLELKRVLRRAHRTLGHPVDVLGMDACLMTMLEVAWQCRDHARVLVGSEEVEPAEGWPHDAILGALTREPAMDARTLATTIVRAYLDAYERRGEEATQSAIDLTRLGPLIDAVDALAGALLAKVDRMATILTVHQAWRGSLRFAGSHAVDLHELAGQLAATTEDRAIRATALDVRRVLEGPESPILAAGAVGPRLQAARGLSIHVPPFVPPSGYYQELDLCRRTRWGAFLEAFLGRGDEA